MKTILKHYLVYKNIALFYLFIGFLTRIVLLVHPITQSSFSVIEYVKIFFFGLLSDFFIFIFIGSLLWLYLLFLSNSKFKKPYGYSILSLFILLFIYILSGKSILSEYGGVLPELGLVFVGLKTILFGLLLFLEKHRTKIRLALFSITLFLFVLVIIQNAISEFFFWNEFGVRYNFIAVDYLVYTNTVIGNIMESYPVVPLFIGVGLLALGATYFIVKYSKAYLTNLPNFRSKIKITIVQLTFIGIALFCIPFLAKHENSNNIFTNELQSNGTYKFFLAFRNSELDFMKFYETLPENEVINFTNYTYAKKAQANGIERHKNVVLITVESLSAEFMKCYGNQENITPFLDKLAQKSLFFTNLYATGNRTVRGLEAVTLCLPPTPGESIVKRLDNKNKFSTGSVFKEKGYQVKFLYGGDAFFDNMKDFFGGNGYNVVDKSNFTPSEVSFSNIWGVCDEDMAKKAIQVMNKEHETGKPFFNHWMTVSNHRPFTYPEGKIDIPSDSKSRSGGVKYTDFALKQFFTMAEKQPWFKNTVFVIVADHCASSSGQTELPVDKYRIPAFIYAPGFIKPRQCHTLMSQIDLMPTTMSLLNFHYSSKFFGENVFSTSYQPRAFIATYQDLGFIKDNHLTIISPVKKSKQFAIQPKTTNPFELYFTEKLLNEPNKKLKKETIAYYQIATMLLKAKKYQAN